MKDNSYELPPLPDLPCYRADLFDPEVRVVEASLVETLLQQYARAAIEADRKHKGEVVVTKTPEGEIIAVTRQDDEGRILSVIAEADSKRRGEPVAPFQGKVERHSDQSVLVRFPSCRLASEFERNVASYAEPVKVPSNNDILGLASKYNLEHPTRVLLFARALLARYRNSDIGQSAEQPDYTSAAKACRSVGANSFAECFERAAQHKAAKYDRDHGGLSCANPEHWNDSSD